MAFYWTLDQCHGPACSEMQSDSLISRLVCESEGGGKKEKTKKIKDQQKASFSFSKMQAFTACLFLTHTKRSQEKMREEGCFLKECACPRFKFPFDNSSLTLVSSTSPLKNVQGIGTVSACKHNCACVCWPYKKGHDKSMGIFSHAQSPRGGLAEPVLPPACLPACLQMLLPYFLCKHHLTVPKGAKQPGAVLCHYFRGRCAPRECWVCQFVYLSPEVGSLNLDQSRDDFFVEFHQKACSEAIGSFCSSGTDYRLLRKMSFLCLCVCVCACKW